jgi:hypothetical protein
MISRAGYWQQAVPILARYTQAACPRSVANVVAGLGAPCPAAIPHGGPVVCAALPPLAHAANMTNPDPRNVRQV